MNRVNRQYEAINEVALSYAPGSAERASLEAELDRQAATCVSIPLVINGRHLERSTAVDVACPHDHARILARTSQASSEDITAAIDSANAARRDWAEWSFDQRAAVFLKAADLLVGPWRQRLNAATMLGQSKTAYQAEIDSACELIDFLRFNVAFAARLQEEQPMSVTGVSNRLDYRPLDGFVYAVTPFNFTAIGGNLPTAPALMGNTVIWKPAATASLSNYLFLQLLEEAGLPPGVINFAPGAAATVSDQVLASKDLGGIHFTGSTEVFDRLWLRTAQQLSSYRSYPRVVGETGGKDFVVAHASADVEALCAALIRGAFEYQGQKCSAASRAYVPASLWPSVRQYLGDTVPDIRMGDVRDLRNFMGAVIDRKAWNRITEYIRAGRRSPGAELVAGGEANDETGFFVRPTVIRVADPGDRLMCEEIFGPVLGLYVYPDNEWEGTLRLVDATSPYALTGAVFAEDRRALANADKTLRFAAGNFYLNDKPTGAVVGQQPFGGARRSGTNDKAGSHLNLLRWTSPRTIKETRLPPKQYGYPHMGA